MHVALECNACGSAVPLPNGPTFDDLLCDVCNARVGRADGGLLVMDGALDGTVEEDYPGSVYALLEEVEPSHFWFGERNRLIVSTLREALGSLNDRRVLDVGCGTGFVAAALELAGMWTCGLEAHASGLRIARRRTRGPLVCMTAQQIPFRNAFDAALLCDVIEHTPDDVLVLSHTSRAVQPQGGLVLVTVPAHQWLWSPMDEVSGHKRRYTRRSLIEAMERAGLRVRFARYFNSLLLPLQVAQRKRMRGLATREAILRQGLIPPSAPLNRMLQLAMHADLVLSRLPWTFGSSLIAIGERWST